MVTGPASDAVARTTEAPIAPAHDRLDASDAGAASVRGGVVRAAGYAVGLAVTVLSAPLLIRHLGVVDFGRYVTAMSIVALTTGVTEGGVTALALREYVVRERRRRDEFMRGVLGLRLLLTLAGVVAAPLFALLAGYDRAVVVGSGLAGIGFTVAAVQMVLAVPLSAELRLTWVTVLDLLRQVLNAAAIVALVLAGAGLVPLLAVPGLAAIPSLVATIALVRRRVPLRPGLAGAGLRALLRDTLPFAAIAALSMVYLRVGIIGLSLISTGAQTGYYATGLRVMEALIAMPSLLVTSVFPIVARAARDDRDRLSYALQRMIEVSLLGGVAIALGLALGARFIVDLLAGAQGQPAAGVLRIQVLALLATFVAMPCGYGLLAVGRTRSSLIAIVVGLLVNIALVVALSPALGAKGAAIADVVAEFVLLAGFAVMLRRAVVSLTLHLRPFLVVVPAAGLGASVAFLGLPSVVAAVLGTAIYVAVLWTLRAIPQDLVQALLRRGPSAA